VAGEGSTFRISLQLSILQGPVASKTAGADLPAQTAGLNVLVIEDNDFNRLIVRDMLAQDGHEVVEASGGLAGVRVARQQRFDAILMDISMPGIDGVEAAARIRQSNGASRSTPIIALTAHALPAETDRFLASGMQAVLVKPITRDKLRRVLAGDTISPRMPPDDTATALIDQEALEQLQSSIGAQKADQLITRFQTETEAGISDLLARADNPATPFAPIGDIHRMAGTAAMFGAAALHQRLTRIEDFCEAGDLAAVRAARAVMAALWEATQAAYRDRAYRIGGDLPQAASFRYRVEGDRSSTRAALGTDPP
jgi:CheY-like chemotaxis protein